MFVRAQEQLVCKPVGNTDAGLWSCGFSGNSEALMGKGFAYQGLRGLGNTTSSSQISKRFAHQGNILRGLCVASLPSNVKAPARLGNPEDRP